jgi:hypothetical protein
MTVNPWDTAALSGADDTADAVYLAVGKALSAWEDLEHQLARLFVFFVTDGAEQQWAAYRAYGSAVAFRGRLEMLQAAAEAHFTLVLADTEMEPRFKALLREVERYAPRRNEIAHGRVQPIGKPSLDPEDLLGWSEIGWCLYPSEYSKNQNILKEWDDDKIGSRALIPR